MVTLSSYAFTPSTPPKISSSGIALTARYKLRAKFRVPPGNDWQATDLWNNDGLHLDNLPILGTWIIDLYAILYDDSAGTFSTTPFNTLTAVITADSVTEQCQNFPLSSVGCVCGTFEEPENADAGRCGPPAVKIDCERPAAPQAECGELNFTIEAHPGETPPFTIISELFDESCDLILDQGGNPILTIVS